MSNKDIVSKAMNEFFVEREHAAIERYWHENYIQHNPAMPNGHEGLKELLKAIEPGFKWEPGIFIEVNDLIIAHSRVQGWGPSALIVVDIFRLDNEKIVEHWDVVQTEVPAENTASGNPMSSFNYAIPANVK